MTWPLTSPLVSWSISTLVFPSLLLHRISHWGLDHNHLSDCVFAHDFLAIFFPWSTHGSFQISKHLLLWEAFSSIYSLPLLNMLTGNRIQLGYFLHVDLPLLKDYGLKDIAGRLFKGRENVQIPYWKNVLLQRVLKNLQRIKVPCFIRWVTVHSNASDLKVLLFPQLESKPQDCVYHLPEASWYRNLNNNTLIQMWREIIIRDKKMRVGDGQVGWLSQLVHPHVVEKRRGLYMCAWPLHPNDTAHLFIHHILIYIQMPDIDLSIFKY